MDLPPESSTAGARKRSTFHTLYAELCRKEKVTVIATSKSVNRKSFTTLEFSTERLKLEDWKPLIEALYHDTSLRAINIQGGKTKYEFQPDIDTEEKARSLKHKYGVLWTDYMLSLLIKSLANSLKISQTLTTIELEGLPVFGKYLNELCEAIKSNNSITVFSVANCPIQDNGCSVVCSSLSFNVRRLNLSGCDLSSTSGQHIAKLIRSQQLNRYTSSWNSSLRYVEPDEAKISGIQHITLNNNPKFGNGGLDLILKELKDDLWIKQIDVQNCSITEDIAENIISTLEYNNSLINANFQRNDHLKPTTLKKIKHILDENALSQVSGGQDVANVTTMLSELGTEPKTTGKTFAKPNECKKKHELVNYPPITSKKSQAIKQKQEQSKPSFVLQKEGLSKSDDFNVESATGLTLQQSIPSEGHLSVKKVHRKDAGNK